MIAKEKEKTDRNTPLDI